MNLTSVLSGGSYWINLTNTILIENENEVDLLATKEWTIEWLKQNHLIKDKDISLVNTKMIDGLKNLRKLCFLILNELKNNGTIQKTKKSAYQQFQDFVAHLSVNVSINIDPEIQMVVIGKTKQDDVLLKISKSIIQTITEVKPERIRKCENKKCILHFVDYSKNGKRRWCRMETCGNRHKAKTFYEKKKETKR